MVGWTIPDISTLIGVPLAALGLGAVALFWAWVSSLRAQIEIHRLRLTDARLHEEAEATEAARSAETVAAGTSFEDSTRRGFIRPASPRHDRASPIVGEFMAYMKLKDDLERYVETSGAEPAWYPPTTLPRSQRRAG